MRILFYYIGYKMLLENLIFENFFCGRLIVYFGKNSQPAAHKLVCGCKTK